VASVYEVELPREVNELLGPFAIAVSFGFSGVGSVLACMGFGGYLSMLVVYMTTPAVVAVLMLLLTVAQLAIQKKFTRSILLEKALPPILQLLFVAYPLVTKVAFDAFSCHRFSESEWLKADLSIRCGTAEHVKAQAVAWVAIGLYPIGLLLLNGALLFSARRAILTAKHTPLSRAIVFLYREFKPHIFWWELVEMAKRFVLVGVMVLAQGSMMQLIMGVLFAASFLLLQVLATPYLSLSEYASESEHTASIGYC
jgi:hypothetical protein